MPREEIIQRDDDERDARRGEDAAHGHAVRREPEEERGRLPLLREAVEHAAVAVDCGIVDRDGCREYDEIQDMRRGGHADVLENLHERTRLRADLIPRPERHEHRHRADIENEDAPDDLIDGARDRAVRILRLARRDADELDAAEREHHDRRRLEQSPDAVRQETAVRPEIAKILRERLAAREKQPQTEQDHAHDRGDLDERHPELRLTVRLHIHEIERRDRDETDERREPLRQVGEPEIHIDADRRELRHRDEHIVEPIIPAGKEPREPPPVLRGVVAERAGHRLIDRHLAEHAHDEEDHDTAREIREHHRRPRKRDRRRRAVEQPRTDRAAERDHLQMAVLEPALHRWLRQWISTPP